MSPKSVPALIRIGRAAEALGVSVETLRRWEAQGTLSVTRSRGGQRLIDATELSRRLAQRRRARGDRPIVAQSARNRFTGIVTRIERDRVAAGREGGSGGPPPRGLLNAPAGGGRGPQRGGEAGRRGQEGDLRGRGAAPGRAG